VRDDRRSAQLIAAVVALVCGAAALWVPFARHGLQPALLDVAVGWTLVMASVVVVRPSPMLAWLFSLGGVLWIGNGLAPYAGAPIDAALARSALAPTALVATAAILLPVGRPVAWRSMAGAALAILAAAVAGAGWSRFAILAVGLAALASVDVAASTVTRRRANGVRALFAVSLVALGVLSAWPGPASPRQVANVHDVVMIGGTLASVWCVRQSSGLRWPGRVQLDEPASLAAGLGQALGTGGVRLAFPSTEGAPLDGWIDLAGAAVDSPVSGSPFRVGSGTIVAWADPPIPEDPATGGAITRLLIAAGDTARLRAALRLRAAEIDESRVRLRYAAEVERARLIQLLDAGPLTSIAHAQRQLSTNPTGQALVGRAATAGSTLRAVVSGLDLVAANGGLSPALARLVDGCGASASIDPHLELPPAQQRAVWFCCAEALANAAKHAPGAPVNVRLRRCSGGVELTVRDGGPGGANPAGSGLSGLQERAQRTGGRLTIDSPTGGGTCLRLTLPTAGEPRQHVVNAALAPMRPTGQAGTVNP
jgi:signal transduction histidine kinase